MYLIYLDESGDSRLKIKNPREESDFFILGGVIVKEQDWFKVDQEFKKFKYENLPKEVNSYPIHAVELNQISRHKKTKYKRFLSDKEGKEFLEKIYKLINELPIEAVAVIIDNHELKRKYKKPKNPYFLSYKFLVEKCQKIVCKRNEEGNCLALVNLAKSSANLTQQLKMIHNKLKEEGSEYTKFDNILSMLNVEENNKSAYYEIADLICYAFRRAYYSYLCKNLKKMPIKDDYLSLMKKICTLKIGKILIDKDVQIKVFPYPRFLKK